MKIKRLDWDSRFFNLEIGGFEANNIKIDATVAKDFDLIYATSHKDNPLEIKGFEKTYTETKVVFSKYNLKGITEKQPFVSSFNKMGLSCDALYPLAFQSGVYSRFYWDKNFSDAQFKALYMKWIDNSLKTDFAEDVLVYVDSNKIEGFVTYAIKNKEATIGLIAVDEHSRGKGIGKALVNSVVGRLVEKGVYVLHIPTQKENINACEFYRKLGFDISTTQVIKHFWKQ